MSRATLGDRFLICAATIAVGYLGFSLNDKIPRDTRRWFTTGTAPDIAVNQFIDELARLAMPPKGNVTIDLPALVRDPGAHLDSLGRLYARFTYAQWPRRMYPVRPGVIVVWARDMINASPPDDPQWLADHGVRAHAWIYFNPTRVHRVLLDAHGNPLP